MFSMITHADGYDMMGHVVIDKDKRPSEQVEFWKSAACCLDGYVSFVS